MNRKIKVLFFVSPYFGGASRMTITIAKLLDLNKYDPKFVVFEDKICEIKNYIPEGYDIQILGNKSIWDFMTLRMIKLFKRERPDIVFGSFRIINFRILLAAKIVGRIKTVLRNDNGIYALQPHDKIFMKCTYPFADAVIAQQEEMQTELEDFLPCLKGRVITLHNYLDVSVIDENLKEHNPYKNDDEIRFIGFEKKKKTKGQDVLLNAFKIVHENKPKAHLYLLGKYDETDSFYKELVDFINHNKLQKHVHFKGLLKNPHVWVKYHERSKDVLVIVCFCSPFVVFMGFCFSRPAWPFCTQAQMS